MAYDHSRIEKKWQERWDSVGISRATEDPNAKKFYVLVEFPYPSGAGLHTGHVRSYTAMDILARKRRAEGYSVIYPIGWDAFGLPTENYAIKTGRKPADITKENTDTFRRQLQSLGLSFDWSREINTTDPKYYKWTQWIFLKLLEHGLAYKAKTLINWCPKDKIGLANEEVVDGKCERCGTVVEKREKEQWMLAITKYAQRLYDDLDTVDYINRAKIQQQNWIGPSEGAEISFPLTFTFDTKANDNRGPNGEKAAIPVFTTRPDTLFGATALILSPEHPWVTLACDDNHHVLANKDAVKAYVEESAKKTDIERGADNKEKTGIQIEGVVAINPASKEEIPIFVADYVLPNYGTGALMAVPAHDERDFAFAKACGIEIKPVISKKYVLEGNDAEREGLETLERKVVDTIIHDGKGNFYLIKEGNHVHFAGGGIEEGENEVTALKREIVEETGFTDFEIYKRLSPDITCWGYRHTKNKNQRTIGPAYEIVLRSLNRIVSEVEEGKHELLCVPKDAVISTITWEHHRYLFQQYLNGAEVYEGDGVLYNSGQFDGIESKDAQKKITESVGGTWKTTYRLRDWVFSRQRYWGEPIPVVHCEKCGIVPLPESSLPLLLPDVEKYQPTDDGESPLSAITEWVNTTCPKCDSPAKRETDTMPNWAGSSWYYLRYADPHNDSEFAGAETLKYWTPVDWYNGGMEHTVLHLLYSRFWHKFLFDIKLVPTSEPYMKRTSHGLILAEGGEKMSKSKGNTVSPDEIVSRFGADALRVYEMFMGPFDQAIAWNTDNLVGALRFLERVERLSDTVSDVPVPKELEILMHQTIKKIGEDIEELKMNTAVSTLMIYQNALEKESSVPKTAFEVLVRLIAPFAPHLAEELWEKLRNTFSVHQTPWPLFDSTKILSDTVTIAIQINSKVRGEIVAERGADEASVFALAEQNPNIARFLTGAEIKRKVYIADKLMNIVV